MQTHKKRAMNALSPQGGAKMENPLAGGMPSLVDGASRKDLPEAMRAKMENAFGADFSNLHIYESEKVAEGGAKAVTQGNTIAFAPGELNLYSPTGEALLGHELSHVVSQARGESRGSGLLDNSYLEAKADREGVMAAAGQQIYTGPVTPISNSTPMSVAGPMQCKKKQDDRLDLIAQASFAKRSGKGQGAENEESFNQILRGLSKSDGKRIAHMRYKYARQSHNETDYSKNKDRSLYGSEGNGHYLHGYDNIVSSLEDENPEAYNAYEKALRDMPDYKRDVISDESNRVNTDRYNIAKNDALKEERKAEEDLGNRYLDELMGGPKVIRNAIKKPATADKGPAASKAGNQSIAPLKLKHFESKHLMPRLNAIREASQQVKRGSYNPNANFNLNPAYYGKWTVTKSTQQKILQKKFPSYKTHFDNKQKINDTLDNMNEYANFREVPEDFEED